MSSARQTGLQNLLLEEYLLTTLISYVADEDGDKKTVSTPATEHRSSLEELPKRKRVRLSRSKQSMKFMIERKKSIIIIINIYYVGLRGKPKS